MLFYKGDGVLASPIYPVADGFDLMPFPTGAPGRQRQRLNHGLFGVLQMGPLLIPIGGQPWAIANPSSSSTGNPHISLSIPGVNAAHLMHIQVGRFNPVLLRQRPAWYRLAQRGGDITLE